MTGEWEETTLGVEVDLLTGFPFKSERYTDSDDSIRLVRGDNIVQGAMRWDGVKKWPSSKSAEHELFQLQEGDVVLAMDRPWIEAGLKYAAISKYDLPCLLVQRTARLRGGRRLDTGFLRYLVGSREFTQHIHAITTGTAVPHISGKQIKDFTFALPSLSEQKAIAAVLGALDDKIELNRRMNATLEAMARALFQSWFVDFDPVRRNKDEGGRMKDEKATPSSFIPHPSSFASLFPATFQDSPIGPVPKGWKVERFDAHVTADRGLSYKGDGLRDDRSGLPMHNLNSVYEGGGYKHEGIKYYGGEYRKKHLLNPGDMIVTNTEQGFDHLLIGHAAIVPRCYGPKGIYSHHIYRVRHKPTSPFSPHYLVELFNNRRWHYWISGFSNGTTINMLPMDALEMPMLVVPPLELVKKFTALAEAAHLQVEDNIEQSRTLATLRDTLLPKLLSGELSVAEAATTVEARA